MAKGARRQKSKLSSGIELFGVSDVVVGEGRGDMGLLMSARSDKSFMNILKSYERMQFGYEVIKLVGRASETIDEPDWFDVLQEVLAGLDSEAVSLELVQAWFYLRYAELLGHELNLWHDVDGQKVQEDVKYRYDVAEKSFRQNMAGEIGSDHIKLLRLMENKSIKVLAQIGGVQGVLGDCLMVCRQHAAV
jgi:recombinational DNA repair protein (RecF pathway)